LISATDLVLAFILDFFIGDPRWAPHPVKIIGGFVNKEEHFLRKCCSTPSGDRWGGFLLVLSIVITTYLFTGLIMMLITWISTHLSAVIGKVVLVWLTATTIATRELIRSAQDVITSIQKRDLGSARFCVSMIMGRDTKELSDKGVLTATIETLAENLSDGTVAPLFYLAIGGLPLAMTYKAVNTLDSMVGYKYAKYLNFGWAAAKLDDIANYVPARITGQLIVIAAFLVSLVIDGKNAVSIARRSFSVMMRDGRKHPSPNSGIPEAAMAGALGVRLGGPSFYEGVLVQKPYIGEMEAGDYLDACLRANTFVAVSAVMGLAIAVSILVLRSTV